MPTADRGVGFLWSYRQVLSYLSRMLGTHLNCSARTVCPLNCWAIFSSSKETFFFHFTLFLLLYTNQSTCAPSAAAQAPTKERGEGVLCDLLCTSLSASPGKNILPSALLPVRICVRTTHAHLPTQVHTAFHTYHTHRGRVTYLRQ